MTPAGASVTVDRRSNALVVSGPEDFRRRVRTLSGRLDTQTNNLSSTAITLRFAEAGALADLQELMQGVVHLQVDTLFGQDSYDVVPM